MDKVTSLKRATQRSFGYQWTHFVDMVDANREHFLPYIFPIEPAFFEGKLRLDTACGFGRHLYYAREFGARMVGVDFSDAIVSAGKLLKGQEGAHLVKADLYELPFRQESFDFIYCLGALHHLPGPEAGFQSLLPYLKRGGAVFIWVYSKKRWLINPMLETVRVLTTRLPAGLLKQLCGIFAAVDYGLLILPYSIFSRLLGRMGLNLWAPPRVRLYAKLPFRVSRADWFDRLAVPIRVCFTQQGVYELMHSVGLSDIRITPTGRWGCGIKR